MAKRTDLQAVLEICVGSRQVYFQPPVQLMLKYPAIVYERMPGDTTFADNVSYRHIHRYQVTVIDEDPDSPIVDKIAGLPACVHERHYAVDGLNHDVFNIWF